MKKGLATLLSLMLLTGLLSGCFANKDEKAEKTKDGKVIVEFWTFWSSDTRRAIIEKIIEDYNRSQDEVYVNHTFLPWGEIWTKNEERIAAGNPADVIINDINTLSLRAANNQVEDLSKYMQATYKQAFNQHIWEAAQYEGKPFAVPFSTDTKLLFYNKKAFKEAGLDPGKPPATWEELEEYAEKLDIDAGGKYERIGFYPLWGSMGASSWMMNADSGKGFIDKGKLSINTPRKVEALEWILSWEKRLGGNTVQAFQTEFGSEHANPFIAEKVAMWIDSGSFFTQLKDYGQDVEFGVAPIPSYREGTGNWAEGGGLVAEIPKGAKHPKEAMDFIKYLTGADAQKYWGMKTFENVANKKAAAAVVGELKGKGRTVYEAALKNQEHTRIFPVPVQHPDYVGQVNPKIDSALLGKISPETALEQAEKEVAKMKK